MTHEFKVGDRVEWNSEAGRVRGMIKKKRGESSELRHLSSFMTKPGKSTVEALIASGKDTVTPVVSDYQVSSKEETLQAATSPIVLTIGHSTRTIEEFINLLLAHGVSWVVDVRTIPRSRHNPQFNADSLPGSLKKVGVGYVHMAGLGGLRHPARDSLNVGWCNGSFRGFADYMQTPEFETSLDELIQLANRDRIALMCAEAVPWRCHRSLIADALLVRGIHTEHILSLARRQIHTLTRFAKVLGSRITYPAENSPAFQSKPSRKRSRATPESTN